MPIYEFLCKTCGHFFERLTSLGGEKDIVCPECSSSDVQKMISSFGIGGGASRLKESGSSCTSCSTKTCSTCH